MTLKRILIIAPLCLIIVLVQSYFWVPTYEEQTTGNPDRQTKFIDASIGDAKLLNPTLNADTASSQITDLVFDGLLDFDENLKLRGRIATDWEISEVAYLFVLETEQFPDGQSVSAQKLEDRIRNALLSEDFATVASNLVELNQIPAQTSVHQLTLTGDDGKPETSEARIAPAFRFAWNLRSANAPAESPSSRC